MKSPKELKEWRNRGAGKVRFMRIENVTPKMWAEHYVRIANEAAIEAMKPQWERDMEAANRLFDLEPEAKT